MHVDAGWVAPFPLGNISWRHVYTGVCFYANADDEEDRPERIAHPARFAASASQALESHLKLFRSFHVREPFAPSIEA